MIPDPTDEHRWRQRMAGTWTYKSTCVMGPDGESWNGTGREVVRAIGDLWVQGELTGDVPGGGSMTGIITLGYSVHRGRFVGSWIGSPSDHLWQYDGTRDASGTVLTLDCTGPSFTDPGMMIAYQDIVELPAPDVRRLRSQMQNEDGSWTEIMRGEYHRIAN